MPVVCPSRAYASPRLCLGPDSTLQQKCLPKAQKKPADNLFPRDKASVRQGIGIPFQPQQMPAHTPTTRCSTGASIAGVRYSTTMPGLMCQGRLRTNTRLCAGQAGAILPVCRQYACSPVSRFRQTHRFLQAYAFLTLLLKRDNAPCSPSPSPVPAQPMCSPAVLNWFTSGSAVACK